MTATLPFFSIVMPVYNRRALVARALRSCLQQTFTDFEVIAVDDGSTDGSADAIRAVADPRIRLLVHERNLGRCPARNTAMAAARGQWFVFLDSDDELLPDALQVIHDHAAAVPSDVVALRYACIDEEGQLSPDPPYVEDLWTYERYLRSFEELLKGRSEALPCSRASTFPEIAYPTGHAEEGLYHANLARRGRVAVSPRVLRRYYQDAPNQITRPDSERALSFAADSAANVDRFLALHGDVLREQAPSAFAFRLWEGALYHFLAGHRRIGLEYARRYRQARRFSPKLALLIVGGIIGRKPLALLQAARATLRRMARGSTIAKPADAPR